METMIKLREKSTMRKMRKKMKQKKTRRRTTMMTSTVNVILDQCLKKNW